MSKLVTIYGGSGFVGRYIARRMAKEGWRVRVAVRRPNEALFVKPYGSVGQVEPVPCNIRDDASVRAVMHGADAVVNCVGILNRSGKNTFDAVQADGAARIARIAAEQQPTHQSRQERVARGSPGRNRGPCRCRGDAIRNQAGTVVHAAGCAGLARSAAQQSSSNAGQA